MVWSHRTRIAFVLSSAGIVPAAFAVPIDINPPGTAQYDEWLDGSLTSGANPGYGAFPGSSPWPGPIGSSAPGSGDTTLAKIANGPGGGPYPAGGSIYFGGFSSTPNLNGGQLAVADATPVADLANVVIQVDIGEAWTYDFLNHALPVLSYNGGTQNLAADNSALVENIFTGTVTMPSGEEPVYRNTWLAQWDLSAIPSITDFSVSFNGVQHAQLYALRLDQSDSYEPVSVPEPAALGLLSVGSVTLLRRRRSRVA